MKCLRGSGRLWPQTLLLQMQLWLWLTLPEEEFLDLTDLETEFFSQLEPEKIFSSSETHQSLPRETRTPFSTLVKDLISLALTEKKGALEGLFILPRLIPPNNNMRGRTAVSKVLQNIGLFRKKECSKNCGACPMLSLGVAPLTQ